MKLILFTCFVLASATAIEEKKCVNISGKMHEREILKSELDRPYLLAVDYSTNELYFSHSVNSDDDVFATGRLNLNNKEYIEIEGVDNGFAQTIDQKTHTVYIGGSDGIYQYNRGNENAELLAANGTNIWNIYYKNVLYFSTFPTQFLYTYINDEITRFKDLEDTKVDHFIIDSEDIMFYTNITGLYGQKKGTKNAILYQIFPYIGARALATDVNGKAYVALQDGIYSIDKIEKYLEKVVEVEDAFGLAFDNNNNIVYADATNLIRLKPNQSCTV